MPDYEKLAFNVLKQAEPTTIKEQLKAWAAQHNKSLAQKAKRQSRTRMKKKRRS